MHWNELCPAQRRAALKRASGSNNRVVGANNQLTSDVANTYLYDDKGNRTKRTNISDSTYVDYIYDHRNRLTQVTEKSTPAGTATKTVKYDYDAFDRRVSKTLDISPGDNTPTRYEYYVWDGDDVVMDFLDSDDGGTTVLDHNRL